MKKYSIFAVVVLILLTLPGCGTLMQGQQIAQDTIIAGATPIDAYGQRMQELYQMRQTGQITEDEFHTLAAEAFSEMRSSYGEIAKGGWEQIKELPGGLVEELKRNLPAAGGSIVTGIGNGQGWFSILAGALMALFGVGAASTVKKSAVKQTGAMLALNNQLRDASRVAQALKPAHVDFDQKA